MPFHSRKPVVYLVGAGPGDPGLLTLRGKECLEQADFILYDQLVTERVLDYCSPHAERLCVRDLPGPHPERWPYIHQRLVEEARKGKIVVRLKGGDPLIFGRCGEEIDALREAGVAYEIVPGVTAALAAGAYTDIPLTHRAHASAIAFITGHEQPGKPTCKVNWQAISTFPGTLAIYMGLARLPAIISELLKHGKPPDTPTAVISRASTGEQQTVLTTLASLDESVRNAGLVTPALVIMGEVVSLKPAVSWFEARPLLGLRVLITRPRHQAAPMVRELELLGAVPFILPALTITAPADWSIVDQAINRLAEDGYDWLAFTSTNGVEAFFRRILQQGKDLRVLGRIKIAVIGKATGDALRRYHLEPDCVPVEDMRSEALAAQLKELVNGKRILLAQAEQGRPLLGEQLSEVAKVDSIGVYAQDDRLDPKGEIFDHLRRGEINVVTLTSPNIARTFLRACDDIIRNRILHTQIELVTNSPRVSLAVAEWDLPVACQASGPTMTDIIACLIQRAKPLRVAKPEAERDEGFET